MNEVNIVFKVIDLNGCIYDAYGTFVDEDRDVQFILCDNNGEFYVTNMNVGFYKLYKEDLEGHVRAQESFCEKVNCKAKKTNADKIRSMTDEELSKWLYETVYHEATNLFACKDISCKDCKKCYLDWLQTEIK